MRPVEESVAERWHRRLGVVYVFCAWNTLGILIYMLYHRKPDELIAGVQRKSKEERRLGYISLGKGSHITHYSMSGVTVKDKTEYFREEVEAPVVKLEKSRYEEDLTENIQKKM